MTYTDLAKKYYGFMAPFAIVTIKDTDTGAAGLVVNSVQVETTSGFEASGATIEVVQIFNESEQVLIGKFEPLLQPGNPIEIKMGYSKGSSKNSKLVFYGLILSVTYRADAENGIVAILECADFKTMMMKGRSFVTEKNETNKNAIKRILEHQFYKNGYKSSTIVLEDADKELFELLAHVTAESDYDYLVRMAQKGGYEFFFKGDELIFRKYALKKEQDNITLSLGGGLMDFSVRYSLANVFGKAEVFGVNDDEGKPFYGKMDTTLENAEFGKHAAKIIKLGTKTIIDSMVISDDMAEKRAAAEISAMEGSLTLAEGTCPGFPDLLPGCNVVVENSGKKSLNGTYYITRVVHDLTLDSGFTTTFKACASKRT